MPYKFQRRMTQPYVTKSKKLVKVSAKSKAASKIQKFYRSRRPARFRQGSRARHMAGKKIVNNLVKVGVLEAKQSSGTEHNEKSLSARCSNNIQYVSFIANDASVGTEGSHALGLGTLAQGVGSNAYVGKYINVKNLFLRFHIMCPPIDSGFQDKANSYKGCTERHLRVMLVAPKLTSQPTGTTLTTEDSLFLDYQGKDYGLVNTTDKPSWELMTAPINKKNWIVYKDTHIKVSPSRIDTYVAPSSVTYNDPALLYANAQANLVGSYFESHNAKLGGKSDINIDCRIPINKKVEMDTTTNKPENLNIGYRFIVISQIPGMIQADEKTTNIASYGSNRVLVSSRSFMQYVDA